MQELLRRWRAVLPAAIVAVIASSERSSCSQEVSSMTNSNGVYGLAAPLYDADGAAAYGLMNMFRR